MRGFAKVKTLFCMAGVFTLAFGIIVNHNKTQKSTNYGTPSNSKPSSFDTFGRPIIEIYRIRSKRQIHR